LIRPHAALQVQWLTAVIMHVHYPATYPERNHETPRIASEQAFSDCVFGRLWIRYYGNGKDNITVYRADINHMCSTVLVQAGVVGQGNYAI
jgi:hypothetical protein